MILTFQVLKQSSKQIPYVLKRYYSIKAVSIVTATNNKDLQIKESALTVNYQVSICTRLLRLFKQGIRLNHLRFYTRKFHILQRCYSSFILLSKLCNTSQVCDTVFVKKNMLYTALFIFCLVQFLEINRVVVILNKTLALVKVVV